MRFNKHSELEGKHAILPPSKVSWINYSKEDLSEYIKNQSAKERGIRLHALAKELIKEGIKLRGNSQTFASYVNDAIGFRMTPEQPLYFSKRCFGTADTISYKPGLLRISDLKTGTTPGKIEQLELYAALFFLEYEKIFGVKPDKTSVILRIYQNDDVFEEVPESDKIKYLMEAIKERSLWADELFGGDEL